MKLLTKTIALFAFLLALFACAVLPLHAADLSDLTWTTTGGEVSITDCLHQATGELVIPDTITGNPVTSIGDRAFFNNNSLTSITIPDSVTSIGNDAFNDCDILTSITIGNSVTSIGKKAFFRCVSLPSITIPDGVTSIGERAFQYCYSLPSLAIPDGVTSIGDYTFFRCDSLTSITIPEGVTSIGDWAFRGCFSLESITFGGSGLLTSIGRNTFRDCNSLTSISIPDSVTSIGEKAFNLCNSLTSITIPDGVTSIGDDAFRDCNSLTSIIFLGAAPAVGDSAFFGVRNGAVAEVLSDFAESFGGIGSTWEGLTVAIQRATVTITDCGFVNATTFFIEFEPAGAGYRVMSSPTLDFGNAVQVTPTLEPTSAEDNRFEFAVSGARNFYRIEPTE